MDAALAAAGAHVHHAAENRLSAFAVAAAQTPATAARSRNRRLALALAAAAAGFFVLGLFAVQ